MKNKKFIFLFSVFYLLWILFWIMLSIINTEYGISGFFYLTITGMPFSFFAGNILPNGGILSLFFVGILGLLQWIFILLFIDLKD